MSPTTKTYQNDEREQQQTMSGYAVIVIYRANGEVKRFQLRTSTEPRDTLKAEIDELHSKVMTDGGIWIEDRFIVSTQLEGYELAYVGDDEIIAPHQPELEIAPGPPWFANDEGDYD
jgi:hypothetical protein